MLCMYRYYSSKHLALLYAETGSAVGLRVITGTRTGIPGMVRQKKLNPAAEPWTTREWSLER